MTKPICCEKTEVRKGPWTPEEDDLLVKCIQEHGEGNWSAVPKKAGLVRCGKSCRLRWANYLRPDLKRGAFSEEEENLIVSLHKSIGNRWAKIATELPGRTDNDIKNHWNTRIKKRLREQGVDPETHLPLGSPVPEPPGIDKKTPQKRGPPPGVASARSPPLKRMSPGPLSLPPSLLRMPTHGDIMPRQDETTVALQRLNAELAEALGLPLAASAANALNGNDQLKNLLVADGRSGGTSWASEGRGAESDNNSGAEHVGLVPLEGQGESDVETGNEHMPESKALALLPGSNNASALQTHPHASDDDSVGGSAEHEGKEADASVSPTSVIQAGSLIRTVGSSTASSSASPVVSAFKEPQLMKAPPPVSTSLVRFGLPPLPGHRAGIARPAATPFLSSLIGSAATGGSAVVKAEEGVPKEGITSGDGREGETKESPKLVLGRGKFKAPSLVIPPSSACEDMVPCRAAAGSAVGGSGGGDQGPKCPGNLMSPFMLRNCLWGEDVDKSWTDPELDATSLVLPSPKIIPPTPAAAPPVGSAPSHQPAATLGDLTAFDTAPQPMRDCHMALDVATADMRARADLMKPELSLDGGTGSVLSALPSPRGDFSLGFSGMLPSPMAAFGTSLLSPMPGWNAPTPAGFFSLN